MGDKPMFFFAGVYDDVAGAEADYESVKELYKSDDIGSYDAAIVRKEPGGKVKVTKTEKPTEHGAWTGLAAGAAAALAFPFLLPAVTVGGMAAAGAGVGSWIAHLAHGTSRKDAREVGELLEEGEALLIVIGVDKEAQRVGQRVRHAKRTVTKRITGDFEEAEEEALAAIGQA